MLPSLYYHDVVLIVIAFPDNGTQLFLYHETNNHREMCISIYQCYLITKRHFLHRQQLSLTCASIWRGRDVGTQGAEEASIAGSRHIRHARALTVVTWKFSTNTSVTVAWKKRTKCTTSTLWDTLLVYTGEHAVSQSTSHVTTKQHRKYVTLVDIQNMQ